MPKQVFFSFDFSEDLWRASVVRNRWIADPSEAAGGFWGAQFTAGPAPSGQALERFVDEQVDAAEVTVVLIGARTASCEHVLRAIRRSAEFGRGMLGIYVDQCRNQFGSPGERGRNPFDRVTVYRDGGEESLGREIPTYEWIADDGYRNLFEWVDDAATRSATRSG